MFLTLKSFHLRVLSCCDYRPTPQAWPEIILCGYEIHEYCNKLILHPEKEKSQSFLMRRSTRRVAICEFLGKDRMRLI